MDRAPYGGKLAARLLRTPFEFFYRKRIRDYLHPIASLCRVTTMVERKDPRLSAQGMAVLRCFLEAHPERLTGSELMDKLGVASGTLYPILARFEAAKWLESCWERGDPTKLGRPRRRFYLLTGVGAAKARGFLSYVGWGDPVRA